LGQRTEQSLTGLGSEDRTKFDWSWVRGPVLIVRTVFVSRKVDIMFSMLV
jgi:hypothetical protein